MRRYYRFAQFAAIFFIALTLTGSHILAQSPEPAPAAHAPTLTVSSRLVVLDVVVTGKDGKPVDGLTRDDFRVYEDNRFEPIRSFEPPSAHTLPAASEDPATVFDPANPKSFGQSPVTVLVLDQLNTHFTDSSFARRELRDYLTGQPALLKQPTTLLTVYDNRFKQLQGFTRSRDTLLKALADAPTKAAWYLEVGGNSDTDSGPVERLQQSLNALVQMSQSFARIPGRKNLIWVGGGFPTLNPTTLDGDHAQEVKDTIQHVTDVLLETHITMYAIDPTSNAAGLTEITNVDQTDFVTAGGGVMGLNIDPFDSAEDFDRLAPVTGGRIVRGLNDVAKQIATSIDLGANFYTLGYVPSSASNLAGKYRHIRVECLRPGVTINTREGYYPSHSESPAATRTDLSYDLSTAAESTIPLNGLHLTVQAGRAPGAYILHVAAANLTWTANDDGSSTAHVAVLAVARSAKDKMLGHTLRVMTATARAGTNLQDPAREADFELTPTAFAKTASLRFVVRDAASGRMGSTELTPPAP
jgi:VWFA-related protein